MNPVQIIQLITLLAPVIQQLLPVVVQAVEAIVAAVEHAAQHDPQQLEALKVALRDAKTTVA